jgi:SAM-dependent methyltransferase
MSKKHLYNTRLGKVRWFVQRFGAREVFMKPMRVVFAPLVVPRLPARTFTFRGRELNLFYHAYNMTWASERCVEVPIGRHFASQTSPEKTLEVGNVLSHYGPVQHDILDKFERGPGVINQDILSYKPAKKYDLVLSISTFEHIGFDDESEDSSARKIQEAVAACKRLLSAQGRLVITTPMGYNPELDQLLAQNALGLMGETYLKKYGRLDWRECPKAEALQSRYREPFPYANAVAVTEFQ